MEQGGARDAVRRHAGGDHFPEDADGPRGLPLLRAGVHERRVGHHVRGDPIAAPTLFIAHDSPAAPQNGPNHQDFSIKLLIAEKFVKRFIKRLLIHRLWW